MAYCPKCGVEVENDVRRCPLCDFPIPDIGEEAEKRYPLAVNTYPEDHLEKKNKAFYALELILFSALILVFLIHLMYPLNTDLFKVLCIAPIALMLFLLFGFNYLPDWVNLTGFCATAIGVCYSIYYLFPTPFDWFIHIAVPICAIFFFDTAVFGAIYKRNRHRNQFIYVPVFILSFTILLTLGIDAVISYAIIGVIDLSWSLIVMVAGICIIALLMGIYHGVPERTRAYLKKKLHV